MRRRALLMGGKRQRPLIIRVSTSISGATPSDTFRIPANAPGETYNYRVDWGDGVITSNHTGDAEHTYAIGGVKEIKIYGEFPRFYFNGGGDRRKLLSVLDWGDIKYSTNQSNAFTGCENLTFIATDENAWYNGITFGSQTFQNNSLTSLPYNMTLDSLINGQLMFQNNSLTSLPDVMTLSSLINGTNMFLNNSLTSLPDVMSLNSLAGGSYMFYNNSLTVLPDEMELSNLTSGGFMFANNLITSAMGLKLHNIIIGMSFMSGADLPVSQYSDILIDIEANNPNDNVTIHFGSSKHNVPAAVAKRELLNRGWTITDGGLV